MKIVVIEMQLQKKMNRKTFKLNKFVSTSFFLPEEAVN
jgi:hypothetical protein